MFRLFGFCSVVQHGASRPGTSELRIRDHPARAADNRARERGSGCSGAAQAFSGVQIRWRLEKTRTRGRLVRAYRHPGAQGGWVIGCAASPA